MIRYRVSRDTVGGDAQDYFTLDEALARAVARSRHDSSAHYVTTYDPNDLPRVYRRRGRALRGVWAWECKCHGGEPSCRDCKGAGFV